MRHWLALSAVAVLAGGCQILNYTWVTPATVAPGCVFTMRLSGLTDSSPGQPGVVFQVPNGFTVLGASVVTSVLPWGPLVRDDPALLGVYTPDPNHYLASFSAPTAAITGGNISVDLKVYVRAPSVPGAYQLEMALAATFSGAFTPQLGLGSFQTLGGSVVRPLQVSAAAAPPPFSLIGAIFDVIPATVLDLEAADVDGDGRDDLLLLIGNGVRVRRSTPGGFSPGAALPPAPFNSFDCTVADFDGDGFVDVALSTGTVLFGNGGTTWTPATAFAGTLGTGVDAGDVDGDGLADLAWGDQFSVAVARGQPNRTFLPWSTGLSATAARAAPRGIQVVDLDADGRAEIVVLRPGIPPRVYQSTAAGVWSLVGALPLSTSVLAIDVDGDGMTELLPSDAGQLFTYSPQGLIPAGTVPVTPFTAAVALDFDRDGRDDLALGVTASTSGPVPPVMELWRNTGGSFQRVPLPRATGFDVMRDFTSLVTADFDGDTFPDLGAVLDQVLAWHNTQRGVAPFGESCAAPGGVPPDLSVQGSILPGQSGVLQLANAAPLGSTLLWLGASRTLWNGQPVLPLDLGAFGAPGCTLLAEPLAIAGVTANAGGIASLPFTVPPYPPAAEVTLFVQGAVLAPAANSLGAVFSRGLALKIQ